MSKVVFGSLVMLGMVALPGPTAVTGGEDKEIVENGASLRMTLYLKSPHTFKGPIAKSNQKSGFRSGKSLGIETSDYTDTTTDASTPTRSDLSNSGDTPTPIPNVPEGGGTSTTNPLSNGGGRSTLPSPPAPPEKGQLPDGVSPPAPPSDADLQAL